MPLCQPKYLAVLAYAIAAAASMLLLSILFLLLLLLHICTAPLDIGSLALAPITSLLMVRVLE